MERVRAIRLQAEINVVDDGSSDDTFEPDSAETLTRDRMLARGATGMAITAAAMPGCGD